ncbi:MAG: hypothetical protein P4L34_04375 [Paludibacter sp.]|nr:hypothetical protein [Paludibacter sp.]
MKAKNFTLLMAFMTMFVISTKTLAQASGDFVATTSGDYNTAANWSIADGMGGYSSVASTAPSTSNNVWIPSSIIMTSSAACNALNLDVAGKFTVGNYTLSVNGNLTIENTGVLTSVNANGGTVADLKIGSSLASGPCTIQVDGQLGSVDGSTVAGSGFRTGIDAGGTTTIQGLGKVNITGLRPYNNNARTQTFVFDMDVNIMNSANNMPTLTLVNGTAATATKTLVINAGKTVTFINDADATLGGSTNGTAVQSSTGGDILYDIEGTLNTGTLGGLWLTTTSSTGNTQSINQKITLRVGPTGILKLGTRILTAVGQPATQSIVYDFQAGSTIIYQGTTAPTFTGFTGFNQSYMNSFSNLTMNNSGGLALPVATIVNNTLTLTSGTISLGTKNLTVVSGGSISGGSATSYIVTDGTGVLNQAVPAAGVATFPIGASISSFDPVVVTPASATVFSANVGTTLSGTASSGLQYNTKEWNLSSTTPSSTFITLTPSAITATGAYPIVGQYVSGNYTNRAATLNGNTYSATFSTFSPFVTGTTDTPTGVENTYNSKVNIYSTDNQINVDNLKSGDVIDVYSDNGQHLVRSVAVGSKYSTSLKQGIYIVNVKSANVSTGTKIVVN